VNVVDMPDPSALSLDELRDLRARLQREDDAVSYARRVAQARLDLVARVRDARAGGTAASSGVDWSDPAQLREVLAHHLTGRDARPPRPTADLSDEAPAQELESICTRHGISRLDELDTAELDTLADAVRDFEERVSSDRRERFARLDELTSELVRRYRAGRTDTP
jgi:hypothetical protein